METLKITLKRSFIGRPEKHKRVLKSLGLKKINQSVIHNDTRSVRGMIQKVSHMIEITPFKKSKSKK
ncbi:MAG: 50S ribosomal protein L30 [Thermodesulfovibrionia bacterium]|nr:50S ribosomal protein L30 [Thermodesulfovibrionia bacterium]